MRNALIVRLLALVADLSRRDGCDLYELAARHRVGVRTIRRDLDALAEAGVPLVDESDGRRKRWRITGRDARIAIADRNDPTRAIAIQAAARGVATHSTRAVLDDLAARLDAAAFAACFEDRSALLEAPLLPLIGAMVEQRVCTVSYRAPGAELATYAVLPLKVFARDGVAYALVHHRRRDVVITLALHRVQRLVVGKERGVAPAGFDAARHLHGQFGAHGGGREVTYRLVFAPEVAELVGERVWHGSQSVRKRRDGSAVLSFACRESYQVAAWVASWRGHVTVLEPASLRTELRELGQTLAARYA